MEFNTFDNREKILSISKITNINLLEYKNQFTFENSNNIDNILICIYKGKCEIGINDKFFSLSKSHMIIVPAESHYVIKICRNDTAVILTVNFACESKDILNISSTPFLLSAESNEALNEIVLTGNEFINPANAAYQYYDTSPHNHTSNLKYQILRNKLELFLLNFIDIPQQDSDSGINPCQIFSKQKLVSDINNYLTENINKNITLEEISAYFNISTNYMSNIYRQLTGNSIIQSFNNMKIELAKKYLEMPQYNVTQVSDLLGFSSIHYFSRIFKKITGISPSQYEKDIKSGEEQP